MNKENLPEIVLGIIKNKNSEVLVVQRVKEEKGTEGVKLSWAFPGGKAEDETKDDAVKRELLEETGYEVRVISIISERVHPQFPVYIYYFRCELESEVQKEKPHDEEIREIRWIKVEDLQNYFTTNLDSKVAEYLGIK